MNLLGATAVPADEGVRQRIREDFETTFLFEAGAHLLLCDLTVMSADFLAKNPSSQPIRILFDPEGRLNPGRTVLP